MKKQILLILIAILFFQIVAAQENNNKTANKVNDNMTFNEAFTAARKEVGSDGMFKWRGQLYHCHTSEEMQKREPSVIDIDDSKSFNEAFTTARKEVGSDGTFKWREQLYHCYTAEEMQEQESDIMQEPTEINSDNNEEDNNFVEIINEEVIPKDDVSIDNDNEIEIDVIEDTADDIFDNYDYIDDYIDDTDDIDYKGIPVITLSDFDLEGDNQTHDISGLLQSSTDVYVNNASYNFGQARYRLRGYDNQNNLVLINGITVNDAESGLPFYSNWGGLNDVTRNTVVTTGLNFSDYSFGNIGGVTNIITRASEFRKGTSISYGLANKTYRNRVMATYSTGLMSNGWAFTASASSRWSQEGYVKATFYQGYSYFIAAEKKLNNEHSLSLTAFGSQSRNGKAKPVVQEIYTLTDNNFYNPNWGYQDGKIRNSKIGNYHQPRAILTHYWTINNTSKLQTSASYTFGRSGTTALNWYDAADPNPDYYRYLPSYYDENNYMHDYLTNLWKNDENYRQLDWNHFYFANSKNMYTVNNASGIESNNITGNRAKYIVEERRNDINRFDFSSLYNKDITEKVKLISGVNYMSNKTHNFKVIDDLLGADFWLDIDQFAERELNDDYYIQSDVDNPNSIKKEDDKFGYDYISNINSGNIFAQIEARLSKIDVFGGINLSYTEYWLKGNMRNGKFPENSYGNSPKQNFFNYGIKAGATYKISGKQFILANLAYLTRAPYMRDAYVSPRTRNFTISDLTDKNLKDENIISGDISYMYRSPFFEAKITGFYTEFNNSMQNNSFYHDEFKTFVNYIMTNMNTLHYGAEFGLEAKLSPSISVTAATGYGKYLYNNRPNVTIVQDNSSEVLVKDRISYLKNYHIGGMPEFAATIGIKYNAPKRWFIGINANYFDQIYITLNPERRTEETLDNFYDNDVQIDQIINQKKLDSGFTVDILGGKSWRIRDYTAGFTLSINNILNNKNFITNGFEQYRFDRTNIDKFPEKYYYMYGTTYFLNLYFRF